MASKILPVFWNLASLDDKERVEAVKSLVELVGEQQNDAGDAITTDLDYSLKRLVRGLSSSRQGARHGYAVALCELLRRFPAIDLNNVLKLMEEHLKVTGGAKSHEERNIYFGQVFGLLVLLRCGRLVAKPYAKRTLPAVVQQIMDCRSKKTYLREVCAQALCDVVAACPENVFEKRVLPLLRTDLECGWQECTGEQLLLVLSAEQHHKEILGSDFFKSNWKHSELLCKKNFSRLADVLVASGDMMSPRIHSAWLAVLSRLVKDQGAFSDFWRIAVDTMLLSSTHERKFAAFQLVEEILPQLESYRVRTVLSANLLRCVINSLSSKQTYLHAAADHLCKVIVKTCKEQKDPFFAVTVATQLLGPAGSPRFDSLTHSSTVQQILSHLTMEGVEHYFEWLQRVFLTGQWVPVNLEEKLKQVGSSLEDVEKIREWAVDAVLALVRNGRLPRKQEWLMSAGRFLLLHGHFTLKKPLAAFPETSHLPSPAISLAVRQRCAQRFQSALTELSGCCLPRDIAEDSATMQPQTLPAGLCPDGELFVFHLMVFVRSLCKHGAESSLRKEVCSAMDSMWKTVDNLRKAVPAMSTGESLAFQCLLLHAGLLLLTEPQQGLDLLNEVQTCHQRLAAAQKKTTRQQSKAKMNRDEEAEWVEVLIDVLLELLWRPSHLLRNVVEHVFRGIVHHLTPAGLDLLLSIIDPKKNKNDMFETVSDEDEAEEEEDNEEEEMEDNGVENRDADLADSESSMSESSDDESDDDDEVDEEFRLDVRAALGDAGATDVSGSDTEPDEMPEKPEDIARVDAALAVVFKQRAEAKRQKRESKRNMTHFKLRVLDLLEVVVQRCAPNATLLLRIVEPLLALVMTVSGDRHLVPLHEKASALLKQRLCKTRITMEDSVTDYALQLLESLMRTARSSPSLAACSLCTQACMLVLRSVKGVATKAPEPTTPSGKRKRKAAACTTNTDSSASTPLIDRVVTLFRMALHEFLEKRTTRLHPVLFTELIARHPDLAWHLAPDLATLLRSAVNDYRRTQACTMLISLLSYCSKVSAIGQLVNVAEALEVSLSQCFANVCKGERVSKAKNCRQLLHVAQQLVSLWRANSEMLGKREFADLAKGVQLLTDSEASLRSPELKAFCLRVYKQLATEESQSSAPAKKKKKVQTD